MANKRNWLAILAITLIFAMTVVGCDLLNKSDDAAPDKNNKTRTEKYQSSDTAGNTYVLIITENGSTVAAGDSYELTIKKTDQPDKVSKGTVSAVGANGALTLQPKNNGSDTFNVTISGGKMTAITGTIALEGGEEPITAPGTLSPENNSGNENGNNAVTFSSVIANGSITQTTTQLTLTFSQAIAGLSADDITLSDLAGVTKGTLSNSGANYTLPISGFTAGGILTVAVAKSSYTITGSPKTVTVFFGKLDHTAENIQALNTYLSAQPANTAATPYVVKLNVSSFGGNADTDGSLGKILRNNSSKYVILDLSGSTFTSIEKSAFSRCTNLTGITISNSVTSIEDNAFNNCTNLISVNIPNNVINIGNGVFESCGNLTSVNIPNNVTSIGANTFNGCAKLTSITIPNGVTSIGGSAFAGCTSLTSVTIPDSVTSIRGSAFQGCVNLTSITIPNRVTSIENYTFSRCASLTSITIPNKVTSIGEYAFEICSNLTSVTILNNVISIGIYAFLNCDSLVNITIPNSITSIVDGTFQGCKGLTSITIPDSVTSIRGSAFQGCVNLTSVTFAGTIPSSGFNTSSLTFPGDLRTKFYAANSTNGTPGTYTRPNGTSETWTKS